MGWWIVLAIFTGLAILPLGVRVKYDESGAYAAVLAGPISIGLYPRRGKKPKKQKKSKFFCILHNFFEKMKPIYINMRDCVRVCV